MEDVLPQRNEKPWGYELLWAFTPQYAGKVLVVKKGYRLSLQYHAEKDESLYVQSGKVRFTLFPNGKMMESVGEAGFCIHFPPGTVHRLEALEESVVLEVSTPQISDVFRLEDDYGRVQAEAVAGAGK